MPKIFNRNKAEYAVYETFLLEAKNSSDKQLRAIAINLECDHRVSVERELEFRDYFEFFDGNIEKSLQHYCDEKVVNADSPLFCLPCISKNDTGISVCCEGFDNDLQLATVLTFHKLRLRIKDLDYLSIQSDLWDTGLVEARNDSVEFSDWLDKHLLDTNDNLKDPNSDEVKSFIKNIFEISNCGLMDEGGNYNEHTRIKPFWVTDWNKFKVYTDLDVDRWNQVVGIFRPYETWQIVITYPASIVDALYRPTQLDGGFYPQHFPPPPDITSATGGFTMDWGTTDEKLLPEFIHKQIKLEYEYWENAGHLIGKTSQMLCDLNFSREKHFEKLKQSGEFDLEKLLEWMPAPI